MTPRQRGDRLSGTSAQSHRWQGFKIHHLERCGGFRGDWMAGTADTATIAP
ncbi:hypothetical protein [Microcoleus sp. B4-C1]|uniref:hypothetical protein n=1 Tax=Microcoleus sp. B4-C1 TaxID=2818660 RepID=UPI002FD4E31E